MRESSARFETVLTPDARLRRAVLFCGCLTGLGGAAIILAMPLAGSWRSLLVLTFILASLRELRRLVRGAARLRALGLTADGRVAGIDHHGRPERLELLSGSMVLGRLAWLRLRFPDGRAHGELLTGNPATDPAWQRLQLIWQLRRGAFGRPQGS